MINKKTPRLQGKVLDVAKADEKFVDKDGEEWRRCVFTVQLTNFSSGIRSKEVPEIVKGRNVKLVRWSGTIGRVSENPKTPRNRGCFERNSCRDHLLIGKG